MGKEELSKSGKIKAVLSKKVNVASRVGHLAATPFKFDYSVMVVEVNNIKNSAGEVCVVWERRDKIVSTRLEKVASKKVGFRVALNMEVTLYKKREAADYEPKMAKFAVRMGSADGRTVGKIHVDISKFARVPSGAVSQDLQLSNGSVLVLKIETRLNMSGRQRRGPGSTAGSERSALTTGSGGLSDGDASRDESLDSLDSLMDEVNAAEGQTSPQEGEARPKLDVAQIRNALARNATSTPTSPTGGLDPNNKDTVLHLQKDIEELEERKEKLEEAVRSSEEEMVKLREELDSADREMKMLQRGQQPGVTWEDSRSGGDVKSLRKRAENLRQQNAQMMAKNAELKKDVDSQRRTVTLTREGSSAGGKERDALKREIDDLQSQIQREPEFLQLATDLRDAKGMLVLTEMERDDIKKQLRELYTRGKLNPPASSVLFS
uniref:C2 NT-type domain-containing protein n=1 Tax=Compsopogon caeruleus TaxID=31354 RepID=A0A7S1TB17_9RHOD|mmetsp:Transcript_15750/g.31697  ORF Transcript_15750/g.31697 Transcript_15750/m.31697 type:complete len:436 (+) Transcript_15750:110-1417(+)